jgi:hypothetical protein
VRACRTVQLVHGAGDTTRHTVQQDQADSQGQDQDAGPQPVRTFLPLAVRPRWCARSQQDVGETWVVLEAALPCPPLPLQPELRSLVAVLEPQGRRRPRGFLPRLCAQHALQGLLDAQPQPPTGEWRRKGADTATAAAGQPQSKKARVDQAQAQAGSWRDLLWRAARLSLKLSHIQTFLGALQVCQLKRGDRPVCD